MFVMHITKLFKENLNKLEQKIKYVSHNPSGAQLVVFFLLFIKINNK